MVVYLRSHPKAKAPGGADPRDLLGADSWSITGRLLEAPLGEDAWAVVARVWESVLLDYGESLRGIGR